MASLKVRPAGARLDRGHVASLAKPAANNTGLALQNTDLYVKGLELLISAVSGAKRVAVLWNPDAPSHPPWTQSVGGGRASDRIAAAARTTELAIRYSLPTFFVLREHVEAGGLLGYGPDLSDLVQRCAIYVGKILRGAKPSELPVEQASKFELVINLKTAKGLGLTIPASLHRAEEVIE